MKCIIRYVRERQKNNRKFRATIAYSGVTTMRGPHILIVDVTVLTVNTKKGKI